MREFLPLNKLEQKLYTAFTGLEYNVEEGTVAC